MLSPSDVRSIRSALRDPLQVYVQREGNDYKLRVWDIRMHQGQPEMRTTMVCDWITIRESDAFFNGAGRAI